MTPSFSYADYEHNTSVKKKTSLKQRKHQRNYKSNQMLSPSQSYLVSIHIFLSYKSDFPLTVILFKRDVIEISY